MESVTQVQNLEADCVSLCASILGKSSSPFFESKPVELFLIKKGTLFRTLHVAKELSKY